MASERQASKHQAPEQQAPERQVDDPGTSAEKPTDEWVTGDEPWTGPQRSYLHTLAREAGEQLPDEMTKAEASEAIDRLQQQTGRGHGEAARS